MAQQIERKDLQFSYFRLRGQKLNEDPKGVMVMHVPSGNSGMADGPDLPDNRKVAVENLYKKMGVPIAQWTQINNCASCGHQLIPALGPEWVVDYTYKRKVDPFSLVVYEVSDEEGWYWESTDGGENVKDGDFYETPGGAADAASLWVKGELEKLNVTDES